MPFNINNFKQELKYGGARPSLFEVNLSFPTQLTPEASSGIGLGTIEPGKSSQKLKFLCKAATIPQSSVSSIEVPYFGRKVKVAGNRTFEAWTITIINDEDFQIRKAFEDWFAGINGHESNVKYSGIYSSPASYQSTAFVSQFSKGPNNLPLRTYKFVNVFPTEVSSIELNWETVDQVEEFTVTLQYDYWEIEQTDTVVPV